MDLMRDCVIRSTTGLIGFAQLHQVMQLLFGRAVAAFQGYVLNPVGILNA